MKKISSLAAIFVFAAIFAVSAFAQAGAQPAASKIGWIDTGMFADEKDGVTKYLNALKALDAELKPRVTELQAIQTKLTTIKNEMDAATRNPAVPVNQQALQTKQDEGLRLQRDGEFKKKEFDVTYEKRSGEVLGPITNDILKALQDYAKQKGYAVVLDIAALANQNVNAILALDPTANISKEFITYYNTRPATTATTAVPK
ncbi:MAG: OmpH family outer membrane protein [Pyrinomonadaceae bacterium]